MKGHLSAAFLLPCAFLLFPLPAPAPTVNVNQDTFVLSNEGPGFLITKLINAGHGADSPYQATVFLASLPGTGAILTPAFMNALATCPASSDIFTHKLAEYSAAGGTLELSTDGSVRQDPIYASTFVGTYPIVDTGNAAVQNVRIVHSTDSQSPLNSTVVDGPLVGMTTTYKAFAVAWALPDSPPAVPAPPSLWLAIAGCLALAGYALWSRRRATLV